MKIGFIGAGKVGCTLAKHFMSCGIFVSGFYSRSHLSALQASAFTNSKAYKEMALLVDDCDCIFITVPDDQISKVWNELNSLSINNKLVGHCSGLLTSKVFTQQNSIYPLGFSLHPLFAIHDCFNSYLSFSDSYLTLEANGTTLSLLSGLIKPLTNTVAIISAEHKPLYHAACVMLSNQVVALAHIGSDLLKQCALDDNFSKQAWHQLFLGNANNICHSGTGAALTGPVERCDIKTIKQHLAVLPDDIKPIYQYLSLTLLKISQQKHPQRDYQQLQLELSF